MSKSVKVKTQSAEVATTYAWLNAILVLLFPVLTIYIPNSITIEAGGSKFFFLSVYTVVVLLYIIVSYGDRFSDFLIQLFTKSWTAKFYLSFLIWALITFSVAYSVLESWLTFTILTLVFIISLVIAFLINLDRKSISYIAIGMVLLLFLDTVQGVSGLMDLVSGKINNPYTIRYIYSNKNIFAAAVFIKIPFAIYVVLFAQKYWKYFAWVTITLAVLTLITLGTKAFYLGMVLLILMTLVYVYIIRNQLNFKYIKFALTFVIVLTIALAIYLVALKLIKKEVEHEDNKIENTISSITTDSDSAQGRFRNWKWSADIIRKNPWMGVGIGNWKIESTPYDIKIRDANQSTYKNHNDFIEMTAETGIFGGLLYLMIFVSVVWGFYKKQKVHSVNSEYYLIPLFGIVAYSVDAFFNFPLERPEIQMIFAILIAMSMLLFIDFELDAKIDFPLKNSLKWLFLAVMFPTLFILYQNFESLKLQKIIYKESNLSRADMDINAIYAQLPSIPTLSHTGEPLYIQKARYLINENKIDEALLTLKNGNTNPYIMSKYYLMANIFIRKNQMDSAHYYLRKVIDNKPIDYLANLQLSNLYAQDKKIDAAIDLWKTYIQKNPVKKESYQQLNKLLLIKGDFNEALKVAEQGQLKLPEDKELDELYQKTKVTQSIQPYLEKIKEADDAFMSNNFVKALELSTYLTKEIPDYTKMLELRAFSNFQLAHYQDALHDASAVLGRSGTQNLAVLNLRGLTYIKLGNQSMGCTDLKNAADAGNKDALNNYNQFCKNNTSVPTTNTSNSVIPSTVNSPFKPKK